MPPSRPVISPLSLHDALPILVTVADVDRVHEAGGQMVVAPNTDPAVITRAVELGMEPMPGVATATDVFAALQAGATALKIFPADRKSTRLNSSHVAISYAVFCLK